MKRYNDMSRDELTSLTDDQISGLIDLEIAYAGIIPVQEPTLLKVPTVDIEKTVERYECSGILFENIEDANTFQAMSRFASTYDSSYDHKYTVSKEDAYGEDGVKKVMFYTKEDVDSTKAILKNAKRAISHNERAAKEHDHYLDSVQSIKDDVHDAVVRACEERDRFEFAKGVYAKHLELAEGNEEVAKNFFRNAYKDRPEILLEVLGETITEEGEKE